MTLNNFAKKNIKRIIIIFLSCFVFMIGTIFYLFFNALFVQSKIKEKVCATVLKHEDDLLATINECKDNQKKALFYTDVNEDDAICYKELNSKTVNTVFRKFRLAYISCYENNIAVFSVMPTIISVLWDNYEYGFYYTAENHTVNVYEGLKECDKETEGIVVGGKYWYGTEKIEDNWYFYERKVKYYVNF